MKKNLIRLLSLALVFTPLALFHSPLRSQDREHRAITAEAYLHRLQTVDAETLQHEYETEFLLLLNDREKKYYQALSGPERRSYIGRYWRLRDPDPFTPNNERLEEHLRRRDYARENFGAAPPQYFDDRGKIYLKYGRPRDRYVDPGIYMQVNRELAIFLPDDEFFGGTAVSDSGILALGLQGSPRRTRETPESLLPPGKVIVLENETWSYDQIQPGLVFNFVRQGKYFKQTPDLLKAVTGGRLRHRIMQSAVMYLQRRNVSRTYVELAREFDDISQRMRMQPGGLQLNLLDNEIRIAVERNTFDREEIARKSPPAAFIQKTKERPLPFVADVAQFRGGQNQTQVAIGFGVNLETTDLTVDSSGHWLTTVTYSYVLNNRDGEPVARADRKQIIPSAPSGAASVLGSIGVMEFSRDPGTYILALQAVAANGSHRGLLQLPLPVRDFSGDRLMLSDIQFYLQIPRAANSAFDTTATKSILYPFGEVLKSIPLTILFEIYNLTAIGLNKSYRLDYRIAEEKAGKNILRKLANPFGKKEDASITISERRTVTQPAARESLSLSLEKLRPGAYLLEITVRAAQDSTLLATAKKQFILTEEK